MQRKSSSPHPSNEGFTLAETIVAAGVALIGMAAAMSLNSAHLRLVKSGRQTNAATLVLQERVEQMRLADWRKLTDAEYLSDTLLANSTQSAAPLGNITERVVISAYPDPTVAKKLIVERDASGDRVTLVDGEGLFTQRLARVEFQVGWTGSDGRQRTRATTTMISNGGISKMNLPAFGPNGSTSPEATPSSTPDPTDTSDPTDPTATPTPTPTATPTPTPTATPPPTPTPSNNGNGNGRGNVGGKPGKN